MRKRWLITGGVLVVLIAGAWGAKTYVAHKVGDEVVRLTQDEDVKKAIDQAIAQGAAQQKLPALNTQTAGQAGADKSTGDSGANKNESAFSGGSSDSTSTPASGTAPSQQQPAEQPKSDSGSEAVQTREEAVSYAMSKFSATEIAHYSSVYANKAKLSKEEKAAIKAEILSRFSAEELRMLQQAATK